MARPDRRGRRNRLRFAAGLSVVVGTVAFLLSSHGRPGGPGSPAGTGEAQRRGEAQGRGEPPSPEAVRAGFEPRDARTTSVALVMVVGIATIAAAIGGMFLLLARLHARHDARPPLTAEQRGTIVPPGPPLQADPDADIASLRRREEAALATYRWLGPDHAAAQIPVARAMALVVGQSLDPAPRLSGSTR